MEWVGGQGGTAFTVHTDVFDGPLDLLLHLVRRDGIALMRLDVSRIADAYLAYLDQMRSLDLAVAADWLVMAATLVHLKSLELLPRPPTPIVDDAESAVDPRDALLDQLAAYERVKAAATALDKLDQVGSQVFTRVGEPAPQSDRPFVSPVDAFGLLDILHNVLVRAAIPEPVVRLGQTGPDLGHCLRSVVAALRSPEGRFELTEFLIGLLTRAERVITFIAVLEMARLGWVDVAQDHHKGPIEVRRVVEDGAIDLTLVTGEATPRGQQLGLPLEGSNE